MIPDGGRPDRRGASTVIGVALLILILVLLAGVTVFSFTGIANDNVRTAEVRATATYDLDVDQPSVTHENITITPEAQSVSAEADLHLEINGRRVHTWDDEADSVTVSCVFPQDEVLVIAEGEGVSQIVQDVTPRVAHDCRWNRFDWKFEYANVNGSRVRIAPEYDFGVSINPDGPGSQVGPVPLSNPWHHVKRYDKDLEGVEGPVYVMVMTDNVHWNSAPAWAPPGKYNWSDDPPPSRDPGADSYEINGNSLNKTPGGSEPTNDIYMIFKPGCDKSQIKIVGESAGYDNQITIEGNVAIPNTNTVTIGKTYNVSGVFCPYDP